MASQNPGKQRAVVYEREGSILPYATAYDDDQAADMLAEVEARYGRAVKARTVYADSAELTR